MNRIGDVPLKIPGVWPERPKPPRVPVTQQVPPAYSEVYNPDLCIGCYGARFVSEHGVAVPCPVCHSAEGERIGRLNDMLRDCFAAIMERTGNVRTSIDSFQTRDDDHTRMVGAALMFATEPLGWLTFHGMGLGRRGVPDRHLGAGEWRTGAGKTHLAQAIAWHLLDHAVPAYYCRAPELYRWLGAVERKPGDPDFAARLQWIHALPVLILDDHNQEHASDFVWQTRSEILIGRYEAWQRGDGGATVICSNDQPAMWDDPSIASRAYQAGKVILASAFDYRVHAHEAGSGSL
jgi:hypothetical protein